MLMKINKKYIKRTWRKKTTGKTFKVKKSSARFGTRMPKWEPKQVLYKWPDGGGEYTNINYSNAPPT